jgi:hypothetical protein
MWIKMNYRTPLIAAGLLLFCTACVPTDDDGNTDPGEVQSVYDPASCTQSDLTADLTTPAYYWSFDTGLEADTGTAQMTANGGAAADAGSLLLDGEDDYLVADGVDKPENYTFSFFVSPNSRAESGQRMVVNLGNGPGSWEGTGVNVREGRAGFFAEGGGGSSEEIGVRPELVLPVDDWTHVLATKNGNTMRLFFNGELVAETSDFNFTLNYGSKGLVFGRHSYFESSYFHGRIDEFAMWDFGFSGGEVTTFTTNLAACQ